jgi:DMSO reductase anchor subunit
MNIFLYTWNNLVTFGLFFSLVLVGGFIWLYIQETVGKVKAHVAHWKLRG